jgi:hypothetical protein
MQPMDEMNDAIVENLRRLVSQFEDQIKARTSEFVLNKLHAEVYHRVKQSKIAIESQFPDQKKILLEQAIVDLRASLSENPKEREVQNQLLEFEKIAKVRTASLSEVYISKPSGGSGRIDILALPDDEREFGRIIELKRPSLKLVANKIEKRASSGLSRAIRQVGVYQDSELAFRGEKLNSFRKTIVAGRKQLLPGAYFIIAEQEQTHSVDVYTWDAWIDRIERIFT